MLSRSVKICFLFYLFSLPGICLSQSGPSVFDHISVKDGLSSDKVAGIFQDHLGFYWISTADGLNRFDGTHFTVYKHDRNNPYSISSNRCSTVIEDNDGYLWVATFKGLNRLDRKTGKFERIIFSHPDVNMDFLQRITSLDMDRDGNIWFTSIGLWKYDRKTGKISGNTFGINDAYTNCIHYDKKNNGLWFIQDNQIVFYDISSKELLSVKNNQRGWKIFQQAVTVGTYMMVSDTLNRLWFGSKNSALYYYDIPRDRLALTDVVLPGNPSDIWTDKHERVWFSFSNNTSLLFDSRKNTSDTGFFLSWNPRGISSSYLSVIFEDKFGNYWIGTPSGINIWRKDSQFLKYYTIQHPFDFNGHVNFRLMAVEIMNDSVLWLGSNHGMYTLDLQSGSQSKAGGLLSKGNVLQILKDEGDQAWIVSDNHLYEINTKNQAVLKSLEYTNQVGRVIRDGLHHIWVSVFNEGLYRYDDKGKLIRHYQYDPESFGSLPYNSMFGLFLTSRNELISYGGEGRGFAIYNDKTDLFKTYNTGIDYNIGILSTTVTSIAEDRKGNFWMGTYSGGLLHYDRGTGLFESFLESDGLLSNFIYNIYFDEKENLWISTSNGVNLLHAGNRKISNIDQYFINKPFEHIINSGVKTSDGRIIFVCMDDIMVAEPGQYPVPDTTANLFITDFRVFDKPFAADKYGKVSLEHDQNSFALDFSAIKPDPVTPLTFLYKLEGLEQEWNRSSTIQTAKYTGISPGNYVFRLKAINKFGDSVGNETSLPVFIKAPIWKRPWFIMLLLMLAVTTLIGLYSYRFNELHRFYKFRTKVSQDLHDEVGATLSGVALFSEMAKQKMQLEQSSDAIMYLDRITHHSKEMVEKMGDIVWALNPQNDDVKKIRQKLHSYAAQLCASQGIQLHVSNDDIELMETISMQRRKNLYLIGKEAINNAVKYSRAKNIFLQWKKNGRHFILEIRDDGVGFVPSTVLNGNGLANMRSRAMEMKAILEINSTPGSGTQISVRI